jgi:hypothetical protein
MRTGIWDPEGPIECPRCGEADDRHEGINICGLCECRFAVMRQKPKLYRKPVTWCPVEYSDCFREECRRRCACE